MLIITMRVCCIVLIVCASFAMAIQKKDHYVCESYIDYHTKTLNPRCFYNPDVGDMPLNIIARHGYKGTDYKVETEDGYILTLIRISANEKKKKGVVYLQHPYTADLAIWIDKGKKNSLAFLLVDEGYEVWMGNSRGTRLSLEHKNMTTKDAKYWNYTFHEIAIYDIPAFLDKAKEVSGIDKMAYVGHSAGSTAAAIYASLLKEHAKNTINLFVVMAPVTYLRHTKIPVCILSPLLPALKLLVGIFGEENLQTFLTFIIHNAMRISPLFVNTLIQSIEPTPTQNYPPWLPLGGFMVPQSANSKQGIHYIQMACAKNFQQYDYGPTTNKEMYGTEQPPEYTVSEIGVPFLIIYSDHDAVFDHKDAFVLHSKLNGIAKKYKPHNAGVFNHVDYAYGRYVGELYKWIIKEINNGNDSRIE